MRSILAVAIVAVVAASSSSASAFSAFAPPSSYRPSSASFARRTASRWNSKDTGLRMSDEAEEDEEGGRRDGWYPGQNLINVDKEIIAFDELYMGSSKDLVLFLPNLKLGRDCNQADAVLKHCIRTGRNFLSLDYYARGDSSGDIMDATLSRWVEDSITMLVNAARHVDHGRATRKAVLVGHATGSWVAVLVALRRPDLVRGIVGIGADPDFTEDLVWKSLSDEDKDTIMTDGYKEIKWGKLKETYMITSNLIEDGRSNLILRGGKESLEIDCPVRLIHDLNDAEVSCDTSLRLAECLKSEDVVVSVPKGALTGVPDAIDQCFEATA
uniref:Serine aminopeptidase S33 domain-containing protein n=1 Tax=Pseudictyota dubia TaxID=2749911 RepID=A0A7R9VT99_9STRA|mmetsp:Transcript_22731/g.42284  ORF Transcript_22731/g.42284 Transcript_22731/m.42284 type:complete len:327 (+) Transcript_22731:104-1084(+)